MQLPQRLAAISLCTAGRETGSNVREFFTDGRETAGIRQTVQGFLHTLFRRIAVHLLFGMNSADASVRRHALIIRQHQRRFRNSQDYLPAVRLSSATGAFLARLAGRGRPGAARQVLAEVYQRLPKDLRPQI
jgi:hypothetical protein